MLHQTMCMACREKSNHPQLDAVKRVRMLLLQSGLDVSKDPVKPMLWGFHSRCRFGLHCSALISADNEAERIAREIEPYLYALAVSDNEALYHSVLRCLQGHFPAVYKTVAEIHSKKRVGG